MTVRHLWGAVRQVALEPWGERCPQPGLTRKRMSPDGTLRLRVTGRLTLGPRDRARGWGWTALAESPAGPEADREQGSGGADAGGRS